MTILTITHIVGYEPTTEDGPGAPIIETLHVAPEDLLTYCGLHARSVESLLRTGSLGEHDEWTIGPMGADYCAKCAGHGADVHDDGCPNVDDVQERA